MAAANLRIAVNNLKKMGEDGMTGFQKQMKVWQFMRLWVYNCIKCRQIIEEVCSHQPVTFNDAEKEYNSSKNRFPDKLPSELALSMQLVVTVSLSQSTVVLCMDEVLACTGLYFHSTFDIVDVYVYSKFGP